MRLPQYRLFLAFLPIARAIAIESPSDLSTDPLGLDHKSHGTHHNTSLAVGSTITQTDTSCVWTYYSDWNCQDFIHSYEYAPVYTGYDFCRSCRSFQGGHSYKLEGDCAPWVAVNAMEMACEGTPGLEVLLYFGPAAYGKCQIVNTGHQWQAGYLCFFEHGIINWPYTHDRGSNE